MIRPAKLILPMIFLIFLMPLMAEEAKSSLQQADHAICVDFYFYNYNYFYFSLDLGYRSPSVLKNQDLRLTGNFRAYGLSVFTFQPGIQEFYTAAELYKEIYRTPSMVLSLYALAGDVLWFSTRTNEAYLQPVLGGGLYYQFKILEARVPLYFRFYNNGFSLFVVPQAGIRLGHFNLHVLFETTTLTTYDFTNGDFRGRIGIGADYRF